MYIVFKKINSWDNTTLYHAISDNLTIPVTAERKTDKIGVLYCVECSLTGYFEVYGIKALKSKIVESINEKYPTK